MTVTVCAECKQECQVVEVDFGIGPYEYWGATGVDVQLEQVSRCCEADFYEVEYGEGGCCKTQRPEGEGGEL